MVSAEAVTCVPERLSHSSAACMQRMLNVISSEQPWIHGELLAASQNEIFSPPLS
jgi:hypothetical protein